MENGYGGVSLIRTRDHEIKFYFTSDDLLGDGVHLTVSDSIMWCYLINLYLKCYLWRVIENSLTCLDTQHIVVTCVYEIILFNFKKR